MNSDPHIVIGHHPVLGIVAADRHNTAVIDHVLRRVGFQPLPDRRQLYALVEPERDGLRRARQAVQSLRNARYRVATDASCEPDTTPPQNSRGQAHQRPQAATAVSPARSAADPPIHPAANTLVGRPVTPGPGAGLRSSPAHSHR